MQTFHSTLSRRLLTGTLLAALSLPVLAQPTAGDDAPPTPEAVQFQEDGFMPQHAVRNGHASQRGHGPAFERLDLSEAQRDQMFTIRHQAEPGLHESRKALRQAHRTLRDLQRADKLDPAALKQASDALGSAVADEARLRVQRDHALFQVLTSEQRKQFEERHRPGRYDNGKDERSNRTQR